MTFAFALSATFATACTRPAIAAAPPAVLTSALAERYPNGVEVSEVTLTPGEAGRVASATSDAQSEMHDVVAAWAARVTLAPQPGCPPSATTIDDVDFYPPASGVIGTPKIVDGVDFANRTYRDGPGNCSTFDARNGSAPSKFDEYTASVEDVFAGVAGGTQLAVVVLRCEYNGHGFDSLAQVFSLAGGSATKLATIGSGGMTGADSALPPWPGGWLHVAFRDGRLYADVWDQDRACDPKHDWISTTYTVKAAKLAALDVTRHHRAGVPAACEGT